MQNHPPLASHWRTFPQLSDSLIYLIGISRCTHEYFTYTTGTSQEKIHSHFRLFTVGIGKHKSDFSYLPWCMLVLLAEHSDCKSPCHYSSTEWAKARVHATFVACDSHTTEACFHLYILARWPLYHHPFVWWPNTEHSKCFWWYTRISSLFCSLPWSRHILW